MINQEAYDIINEHADQMNESAYNQVKQLYNCKAWLYESKNCIWLKSYNTFIAVYDIDKNILVDCLRTEFGYTATSAQHIAKFRRYLRERRDLLSFYEYPFYLRTR